MGKSASWAACVLALGLAAGGALGRPGHTRPAHNCASDTEMTSMQLDAIQQELMDAALTCGDQAQANYNEFQTRFRLELRKSDRTLLTMFRRVDGFKTGDAAYNKYKTDMASIAELHRIHGSELFCSTANQLVVAALGQDRRQLNGFISNISVFDDMKKPVESCTFEAASEQPGGIPAILPVPNPLRMAALAPKHEAAPVPQAAENK